MLWKLTRLYRRNAGYSHCNHHESFVQLTPYCAAVYYHRPAVADYLASQGATLDIFRAAFMGDLARGDKGEHPEKMRLLLERGAKVDARGPKGRTALPYAASAGFLKVIALLLEQGADAALVDDAGETALSLAQAAGKMDAAKLLQLPIV
jgi:ankyrin repeat protein